MSMMFKPPFQLQGYGFRDFLALEDDNDFYCQLRTAQVNAYYKHLPFNMAVSILTLTVLISHFFHVINWAGLWWGIPGAAFFITFGLLRSMVWNRRGEPDLDNAQVKRPVVGRNDMLFLLMRIMLGTVAASVIIYQAITNADDAGAMMAIALTIPSIATIAFSTAAWPLGSMALVGPLVGAIIIGATRFDWQIQFLVWVMMIGAGVFMGRAIYYSTRGLMDNIRRNEKYAQQEEVVRLLLNEFEVNGSEWLFEFGSTGCLTFASSRMGETFRKPVGDMIGLHWSDLFSDEYSDSDLARLIKEHRPFRNLLLRTEVEGEARWISISGTPKFDSSGTAIGYRGVGSDVTDRHRAAERIAELATFDSLTGLVNRRIIHQELEHQLAKSEDADPEATALLFVDLDRFKAINDSLGHGSGDMLLAEVSRRMRTYIARNACDCALVGRLGGDEFAIILCSVDSEEARQIGAGVIEVLSQPYQLGDRRAVIGASVGMAMGPRDGANVEELMRAADLALYEAKEKGRGKVCQYDRQKHEQTQSKHSLELDLRHAIANRELYLEFQPVVNSSDERVVGFEALLRWKHPKLGNIPPLDFISIAEEVGLIGEIGAWVLNEACRTAVTWPRDIRIAVNVSPKQFEDGHFVDIVRQTLQRWNLDPSRLELELTEGLFLDQDRRTTEMLQQLQDMGVGFALDDFGTGYSSLGYLQNIAFRRLKIDRSFVNGCSLSDTESVAIIQAIVALATRLGIHTTAEGTETRLEVDTLRSLGCEQMQGYYFGRPMSAENASRLLHRSPPRLELVFAEESDSAD